MKTGNDLDNGKKGVFKFMSRALSTKTSKQLDDEAKIAADKHYESTMQSFLNEIESSLGVTNV